MNYVLTLRARAYWKTRIHYGGGGQFQNLQICKKCIFLAKSIYTVLKYLQKCIFLAKSIYTVLKYLQKNV